MTMAPSAPKSDPEGGYAIPSGFEQQIIEKLSAHIPSSLEAMADAGFPLTDAQKAMLAERERWRVEARRWPYRFRAWRWRWGDRVSTAWEALRGRHECGGSDW